jgi:hypothetical protein
VGSCTANVADDMQNRSKNDGEDFLGAEKIHRGSLDGEIKWFGIRFRNCGSIVQAKGKGAEQIW